MIYMMMIASLVISILFNVASSCYICYNVAVQTEKPVGIVSTVSGIVLLNALIPFSLGCFVTMWYMS